MLAKSLMHSLKLSSFPSNYGYRNLKIKKYRLSIALMLFQQLPRDNFVSITEDIKRYKSCSVVSIRLLFYSETKSYQY